MYNGLLLNKNKIGLRSSFIKYACLIFFGIDHYALVLIELFTSNQKHKRALILKTQTRLNSSFKNPELKN